MNNENQLANKKIPKSSQARLKANKKYDKTHYKTITGKVKIGEYPLISEYAEKNNMSISKMIVLCVKHCINNDIILIDNSDSE